MSAALPRSSECTNLWILLYQSANLELNLCYTCNSWYVHQDWKIEHWENECGYTHIWVAHYGFQNFELPHRHRVAQVAYKPVVAPVLVQVYPYIWASRVFANSLLCHCEKESSHLFNFHEPLQGVISFQHSPFYTQVTKLPASSHLRLQWEVFWLDVVFPPLRYAKSLLCPFWPDTRNGTCWSVLAVPDLPALPYWLICWKSTRNLLLLPTMSIG